MSSLLEKNRAIWDGVLSSMLDDSFIGGKTFEDKKLRLEVTLEGDLQGILIKDHLDNPVHNELHVIGGTFDSFYRSGVLGNRGKNEPMVSTGWLSGYRVTERKEFWKIFKEMFFRQVIQGKVLGANVQFYCPDLHTLHKWVEILEIKP